MYPATPTEAHESKELNLPLVLLVPKMPFPDYLDKDPRIIFFTDFDGTVTAEDMIDWLVMTEGFGPEELRRTSQAVLDGTMNYREASRLQIESIKIGFDKCIEKVTAHVRLDNGFLEFYNWAQSAGVPIVVLSGGLDALIEAMLKKLLGFMPLGIEIVANSVAVRDGYTSINADGGAWTVQFRDESKYGHDKAHAIKPYFEHRGAMRAAVKPILLFAGDGISDLGAAKSTDLLFVKHGTDLIEYCKRQQLPYTEFRDWFSILRTTQDLYYGMKQVTDVANEGTFMEDFCAGVTLPANL